MMDPKELNDLKINEFERFQVNYKQLCEWQAARRRCFDQMVEARDKRRYAPYADHAKTYKAREQYWKRAYWHWSEKCNTGMFGE